MHYIGLFVAVNEIDKLIDLVNSYIEIPANSDIHCSHCTLLHVSQTKDESPIVDRVNKFIESNDPSKLHEIKLTHIGFSNKAMAFKVDLNDIPCANENPHITICTYNNGSPRDSNYIENWVEIKPHIVNTILNKI